jgi:hypothetical protein
MSLVFLRRGELPPKKTKAAFDLVGLFRPYGIPPTPLHEAVQEAATKAGWIAPWDRYAQQLKKKEAGKKSGRARAGLAMLRHSLVREAHARLKPAYRFHPSSTSSIHELHQEYLQLLAPGAKDLGFLVSFILGALSENDRKILSEVKRETLKKDLKVLGIRSKRQQQRPG